MANHEKVGARAHGLCMYIELLIGRYDLYLHLHKNKFISSEDKLKIYS